MIFVSRIVSIILLAIIHEVIQSPMQPLGEVSQVDPKNDDENGSLSDENFLNSLNSDFVNNERDDDEDNDKELRGTFEGDDWMDILKGDNDQHVSAKPGKLTGRK